MWRYLLPLMVAAIIIMGCFIAAAFHNPHDQIVEGIRGAKEACEHVPPQSSYERKVCALVAPSTTAGDQ